MNIQYISDSKGITTGVFIPIQDWTKLKENFHLQESEFELSSANKDELDRRIDEHVKNPTELLDWEDVKKRLIARNS